MRSLLVGDVHGCAAPLRALLEAARPDRLVLLGDLFAKGPDPQGVWDVIQETAAEAVLGNHDARMLAVWDEPGSSRHHEACRALPPEARRWTEALPLSIRGDGWLAIHAGVHPFEGLAGTTRRMALVLRRWPDDDNPENPFWWQLYEGPDRVFYGHDAMRGLQVHPRSVGLDTGAVYGNTLTGWLLEEDRPIAVPGNVARPV